MPKLLTKRKQAWANKIQRDVIYGKPLNPNLATAQRYYKRLAVRIELMCAQVEKRLTKLFNEPHAQEYFAEDASVGSQARILTNALTKKFDDLFATIAKPEAERMATEADKASATAVRSSIKELSGGLSLSTASLQGGPLNDILTATVAENVGLIKSISSKYLTEVQGAVMRSITTGKGLEDLIPYLEKQRGVTHRRAQLIAYDQTRKAFESLSRGRMLNLGIQEGRWIHSGGSNHPRKTHIEMSGKIFSLREGLYDSAVQKYVQPGELPYCRCRTQPVLRLNGEKNATEGR